MREPFPGGKGSFLLRLERRQRAIVTPPTVIDRRYRTVENARRQRTIALGLFLACTTLYFVTRSPALDEWDSIQFALGVGDFNLWRHQPHPPGYPVYIAFGWLFSHLLPLTVPTALAFGSALGGGLFVGCWYLLLGRRFPGPVAWVTTAALATLLITWMTATKVLTDGLEAGLLAATLLALEGAPGEAARPGWRLVAGALLAALTAGVRPQNTGVILLILLLAIPRWRPWPGRWIVGLGAFVVGCGGWLLPMAWLQARTPEAAGDWRAYPRQLLAQWRWRLDQPKAFLGATGQTRNLLIYRLEHHPLGWLTHGFGFALDSIWGWLGIGGLVLGWTFYGLKLRRDGPAEATDGGAAFWRRQLPWAIVYVAMIFCCLPGDQRYYLPIFPLLIVPVAAGWWWALGRRSRWLICVLPLVTLLVTLPYAVENHTEAAPPVRMLRWLAARWPTRERPQVWLVLRDSRRHAEWYAPAFHIVRAEDFTGLPPASADPQTPRATYTDDPLVAAQRPLHGRWLLLQTFSRSPLIYRKHNEVSLYVLAR
jgi:hypothetical protein